MQIQILGIGFHNCLELEMRLTQAIARAGRTDVEVRQEDHIPLESIPGLLIDGQLISQREVPTIETLLEWFETVPAQRKD